MKKTLISILNEIRWYIIMWGIFIFSTFIFFFIERQKLYQIIIKPIRDVCNQSKILNINNIDNLFIYTSIWENFTTDISISFYFSFICSIPLIMFLLYCFISKSLYPKEKIIIRIIFILSFCLMVFAVYFCYYFLLPRSFEFFISMYNIAKPMFKIGDYVSTFFHLIIGIAIAFQFPVILVVLTKFGFVDKNFLSKYRKYAIVIIFIIAAIITPPDVFSQVLVATMFIIFYEITNYMVVYLNRMAK